jgi:hypothetical protein
MKVPNRQVSLPELGRITNEVCDSQSLVKSLISECGGAGMALKRTGPARLSDTTCDG